ncbi:MAG: HAMP domain-containing histidine kinase [Bacilli bacterium]|nr:HAMP domain-containing histidine kinase [Bacilli bacterium]
MIAKLRRKFVLFALLSVSGLLAIILVGINIANFSLVASSSDSITAELAQRGGEFIPNNPGEGGNPIRPDRPDSPDMQKSMRYFTVRVDGTPTLVTRSLDLVSDTEALTWAKEAATKGEVGWYRTYYRFRNYQKDGATYVTFIDASRELSPSFNVLNASLIGGGVGILATFLLLLPISKILVRPTEEAFRRQKRFVSDASHELKTPLSIISANNEIQEMVTGETEQTKAIGKQVKAMNSLVRNLNALAKIDEVETHEFAKFDLSFACSEIAEGFRKKAEAKGLSYEAHIASDLVYKGEEASIRMLFSTVIENAVKYGQSKAEISLQKEGDHVVFLATNDAEGLQEGPLEMVFERFYRSPEARASGVEGSGIGLSMAKEIVSAHKGRIFAWGEKGIFHLKVEL